MKKELMDILCCPICKGDLQLQVEIEEKNDIITGVLTCNTCKVTFPINDGIPDLLPK